jgi:hypothetical protein
MALLMLLLMLMVRQRLPQAVPPRSCAAAATIGAPRGRRTRHGRGRRSPRWSLLLVLLLLLLVVPGRLAAAAAGAAAAS